MTWCKRVLPPILFLAIAACNEAVGPAEQDAQGPTPTNALHHLQWKSTMTADRFTAAARNAAGDEVALAAGPTVYAALNGLGDLSTYHVSFWAVSGEERSIQIDYLGTDSTGQQVSSPYLRFTVPPNALMARPDGSPIVAGDSVLITLATDSTDMVAHMEPSGLQFHSQHPAELTVWYEGANPDLNTDGSVNGTDHYIEENDLGVWVQQSETDPWEWVPSQHTLTVKTFDALLEHFSSYVISW